MSALALAIDETLQRLDAATAARLERLVREALALVSHSTPQAASASRREQWLLRLDQLRDSVGTGTRGTSTEGILDDLRSDRD
jgi:hypothetical protein